MLKDKKEIGRRIRQIRNGLGLNQKALGDELGVATSSVSAYESGATSPPFEIVAKIAKLGRISIDDLLTGGPESAPPYPDAYDIIRGEEEAAGIKPKGDPKQLQRTLLQLFSSVASLQDQVGDGPVLFGVAEAFPFTEEDKRLLAAFHKLDEKRRTRLIEEAEDMVLASGVPVNSFD
jgi:transcriptional regulator with XRE-family HTH domain